MIFIFANVKNPAKSYKEKRTQKEKNTHSPKHTFRIVYYPLSHFFLALGALVFLRTLVAAFLGDFSVGISFASASTNSTFL